MNTGRQLKRSDTHILWAEASANFACLCGNYIVVSSRDGLHTCKECGRIYAVEARIWVEEGNVRERPKTAWASGERCPVCNATLNTDGRRLWCSLLGCEYRREE